MSGMSRLRAGGHTRRSITALRCCPRGCASRRPAACVDSPLFRRPKTVIAHVSVSDLQRNADRYADEDCEQFDRFAPGWRDKVSKDMSKKPFRAAIMQYWSERV